MTFQRYPGYQTLSKRKFSERVWYTGYFRGSPEIIGIFENKIVWSCVGNCAGFAKRFRSSFAAPHATSPSQFPMQLLIQSFANSSQFPTHLLRDKNAR